MKFNGNVNSVCLAILLIAFTGCLHKSDSTASSRMSPKASEKGAGKIQVKCVIEFNGRRERVESEVELDSETATAFEALKVLAEQKSLEVESRGDGESRFVVSVGGFGNEGAGGKNWIYKVDGKLGNRSSEVFQVSNDQVIQWSLGIYP